MAKQTMKEKVDRFLKNNPETLSLLNGEDMDEIYNIGGTFNIIKYAFFFGYMQSRKQKTDKNTKLREKAIDSERQKIVDFISHIDEFWTLNQCLRFLINMTKDTKYEVFAPQRGGADK